MAICGECGVETDDIYPRNVVIYDNVPRCPGCHERATRQFVSQPNYESWGDARDIFGKKKRGQRQRLIPKKSDDD